MKKLLAGGLLLTLSILACHKSDTVNKYSRIDLLVSRSCRAINLRHQRFALADKMRFAQEAMGHGAAQNAKDRINRDFQSYIKQKDVLLKESLALADTIRLQLDSLKLYSDKTTQKIFQQKLDSAVRHQSGQKAVSASGSGGQPTS